MRQLQGGVVKGSGSARHRSREVALQALYALDLLRLRRGEEAAEPVAVFERVASHFEMPAAARAFAHELVVSVAAATPALDEEIAARARNWRLSRMACVDRNILRLATWELRSTATPTGVVLNEAVELARSFGSDESPAFVNGILDAIAREARGPADDASAGSPP